MPFWKKDPWATLAASLAACTTPATMISWSPPTTIDNPALSAALTEVQGYLKFALTKTPNANSNLTKALGHLNDALGAAQSLNSQPLIDAINAWLTIVLGLVTKIQHPNEWNAYIDQYKIEMNPSFVPNGTRVRITGGWTHLIGQYGVVTDYQVIADEWTYRVQIDETSDHVSLERDKLKVV